MGIRVKNSFSEYCSRSILALWILCGLILASSNSFAADIPPATFHAKCWNWFRSFAGKTANRETKEFKADAKLWDEYFGANGKAPRLHGVHSGDINNPIFWESWKLLPEKLQQEILAVLDIPTSTENQFFKSLDKKLTAAGLENIRAYESFLSHITIGISRNYPSSSAANNPSIKEWFLANFAKYEESIAKSPATGAEAKATLLQSQKIMHAKNHWLNFGSTNIKTTQDMRGRRYVHIHGEVYRAYPARKNGMPILQIEVPTNRLRTPANNPLESEKLKNIVVNNIPAPSVYKTSLGPDGYFYLQDGNHRFAIRGKDKSVSVVELSDPPRTMSLRNFFDSRAIPQPTDEELLGLYDGSLSIEELLKKYYNGPDKLELK